MHPIFHSFKRLHWSSMRFSRDWADEFGTTPARFDMMLAIAQNGGITQANLRRTLDVCGPVVGRMLKSLWKRGLVDRVRYQHDRRTYWIFLTESGKRRLALAQRELLEDGFTESQLPRVVSDAPHDDAVTARAFAATNVFLRRLRRRVVDGSTLLYPAYLRSDARSPDFPIPVYREARWPEPGRTV